MPLDFKKDHSERVSGQHGDSDGVLETPRTLLKVCFQAMYFFRITDRLSANDTLFSYSLLAFRKQVEEILLREYIYYSCTVKAECDPVLFRIGGVSQKDDDNFQH